MKIRDVFADENMALSMSLADIMVHGVEEVLPKLCEAYRLKGYSNYSLVYFAIDLDLPDEDVVKILRISSRYAKNWTFS
jgi:hypothetical protein